MTLDTEIFAGDPGHIDAHQIIAKRLNATTGLASTETRFPADPLRERAVVPTLTEVNAAGGSVTSESDSEFTTTTGSTAQAAGFVSEYVTYFEVSFTVERTAGSSAVVFSYTSSAREVPSDNVLAAFYLLLNVDNTLSVVYRSGPLADTTVGTVNVGTDPFKVDVHREFGRTTATITPAGETPESFSVAAGLFTSITGVGPQRLIFGDANTGYHFATLHYTDVTIWAAGVGEDALLDAQIDTLAVEARPASGSLAHPYLRGGHPNYNAYGQFHNDAWISTILLAEMGQIDYARGIWLNFLDNQAADGRVGFIVRPAGGIWDPYSVDMVHSAVAQACYLLSADGDVTWFDYAALKDTLDYWETERLTDHGLFSCSHPSETGLDGLISMNPDQVEPAPTFRFEWIGQAAMLVREYQALAAIARALDNTADETTFRARAASITTEIQTKMFSEERGWFHSYDLTLDELVTHRQGDGPYVLWAGAATQAQAQAVRDNIMDPDIMLGAYGMRSLDATDPFYEPSGVGLFSTNWNGPLYPEMQFYAAMGLRRYGFHADAAEIARRCAQVPVVNASVTTGGGLPGEWNNPQTGLADPTAHNPYTGRPAMYLRLAKLLEANVDPTWIGESVGSKPRLSLL